MAGKKSPSIFSTLQKTTENASAVNGELTRQLPVASLVDNPMNRFSMAEDDEFLSTMRSVEQDGFLEDIVVTPDGENTWRIISGHRRVMAARKLGKSRSALANSLRLLNLPENVLELLKSGFINTGHAKVILGLPTPELQEQAAQMIADHELNVRQAEVLCKKLARPAKGPAEPAPIDTLPVEVEESLKEVLGSEVNVAYHGGKGRLTVHFYSDEQLRAFANLLGQYQQSCD